MTGTHAHLRPRLVQGLAVMNANTLPFPADQAGVWLDLPGTETTLPEAGTYNLDATWRAQLQGVGPVHHYVSGRIWDVTAGAAVPFSGTWVCTILEFRTLPGETGVDRTADAHVPYTIPGPRTLRMQAVWVVARPDGNPPTIARMISGGTGYTRIRWTKVGD